MTGWPQSLPTGLTTGQVVQLRRENVRSNRAYIVIAMLVLLAAAVVALVAWKGAGDDAKLIIAGVFTPVVGIAGTVLGFYFGAETQRNL